MNWEELTKLDDRYVLVVEDDAAGREGGRAIVWEHYLDNATLPQVKTMQAGIGNKYGRTKIARLQFVED